MNTDWLRYFVVLAETRNFHGAAERLHISPQALSKAIAGLEAELKVSLVDRQHRVRGLTAAGEELLEEARKVLQSLENAERRMTSWQSPEPRGPVSIAGDGLWHHYLLAPLLADVVGRFPGIRPRLHEMLPDDVEKWVAAGDVDIGLLLRAPVRTDLGWLAGTRTPYVIAGLPGPLRPWQELGFIVPRFFRKETPQSLDGWPDATLERRIVAEVELLETAIHLVQGGVGVAFLPQLALQERFEQGRLAVVAEAPCEFHDQLHIVWRKGVRPTREALHILEALRALGSAGASASL